MKLPHRLARGAVVVTLLLASSSAIAETRINAGTAQWAAAARAGRADVLFFGDSIVNYGHSGWSNGLAQAAQNSDIGLAGSGLLTTQHEFPFTWSVYTGARVWSGIGTESTTVGQPSLTPSSRHLDVKTEFAFFGTGFDALGLDVTKPIDWHVFGYGTSPAAQLQASRTRRTINPWTSAVNATTPAQAVSQGAIRDYVFSFDGAASPGDWTSFEFMPQSRDTLMHYTKLLHPQETGITVTGWGYSGGRAEGFRTAYYNHPRFTSEGRTEFYKALVAGNSGKLNVAITYGVNDASGVPEAEYGDSIRGIIADVRRDWANAGMNPQDLSFTLVSGYEVNTTSYAASSKARLERYRGVLDAIAANDPMVSFIDMWDAGPSLSEALANGYLNDDVHPSVAGTAVYGRTLLEQLMPTPGDTNIDGDVDFDDLLVLAQNYEQTSGVDWRKGDFDGLLGVNFADLLLLAQHYGHNTDWDGASSFEGDWALARALVPEPASLALLTILTTSTRRRRG